MHILDIVVLMSVSNGKKVHYSNVGTEVDDNVLNHSVDYESSKQLRSKSVDRTSSVSTWRKHAFNVILPRKLSEHSDSDLRLMLVSLKNTSVAVSVHIQRIERELRKRGSKLTILG